MDKSRIRSNNVFISIMAKPLSLSALTISIRLVFSYHFFCVCTNFKSFYSVGMFLFTT